MKKILTSILVICLFATANFAQERYLDPIFSNVTVTPNVVYGQNYTVLTVAITGNPGLQTLVMDMYQPTGDAETSRPLVLLIHTGNFLPNPQNGSVSGTMRDSFVVETATRLARMGYVVAVPDYRLGWNPLAQSQEERAQGLIQAAYRGVQDMRTCIRFFKKNYAVGGNTYGIDTSKITLFGQGTGGYISLATATLDDYTETLLPKFIASNGTPMIIPSMIGDIYGTSVGVVPMGLGTVLDGDTLCIPNHVGYSSDFQLCVNTGGALGDTSWLDAGDPAMVSFQCTKDPFAPYMEDLLVVPTTGDLIVEVQGAYLVQARANSLGNNNVMKSAFYGDAFSAAANAMNDGFEGLYPMKRPSWPNGIEEGAPWEWWSAAYWSQVPHPSCPAGVPLNLCNFHTINSINNPNMSKAKAMAYIDTIVGYFAPRACAVLGLPCSTVSTKPVAKESVQLVVAPNPAHDYVRFTAQSGEPIVSIELFDVSGRMIQSHTSIKNTQFDLPRNGVGTGLYFARVQFATGIVTEKIMFD